MPLYLRRTVFAVFFKVASIVVWQHAGQMSDFRPEYATLAFAEEAQTEKYKDLYREAK